MTSAVELRMFVSFFSRVTLTSRSSARGLMPTTWPSYVSWPGSTKNCPRSASWIMANGVIDPERSDTSDPVCRERISPAHGR